MGYSDLIEFVLEYRRSNPAATKQQIETEAANRLRLTRHKKIYACPEYAVRFSSASGASFSNVVLSLSALKAFDDRPFIVVVVRPTSVEFLLANTTLLAKISHSSRQLRIDNIRGSFLGTNIMRDYSGLANRPENFDALVTIHQEFTWEENLERLVEATNAIVGRDTRFQVTDAARDAILASPFQATALISSLAYSDLKQKLSQLVHELSSDILDAAAIENVNLRGNRIEQLVTGSINEHRLADMISHVDGIELHLEIKTKLMDRASAPKAYNVDKALRELASGHALIAFCFIGVHVASQRVTTSIVSIFDSTVLDATRIQHHWAGRNSRGVTQLTGDLTPVFSPTYQESIDVAKAQQFLENLMNR